jgi:hypothetical protein
MKQLSMEVNTMKQETEFKCAGPEVISRLYNIPTGTLGNLRSARRGPKFYKRGRRVFYFLSDVEEWLRQTPILTTDSIKN